MKNWKTTLIGGLTGLTMIAGTLANSGIHIGHWGGSDFTTVVAGVGSMLLGLYAKDRNVTGGTIDQTKP